jgi:hypothetical protein
MEPWLLIRGLGREAEHWHPFETVRSARVRSEQARGALSRHA